MRILEYVKNSLFNSQKSFPTYQFPTPEQFQTVQLLLKKASNLAKSIYYEKSPSEFFCSLNYLLDILLGLRDYEIYGLFYGSTPTEDYNNILNNLQIIVDGFLDRSNLINLQKVYSLKTQAGKERNRQRYLCDLQSAFSSANSFWLGSPDLPHYTGPLYTPSNYDHVGLITRSPYSQIKLTSDLHESYRISINSPAKTNMSISEEKMALVKITTDSHLQQLSGFPFVWNQRLQKKIEPNGYSFCYMDITGSNILAVKNELTSLNLRIQRDCINEGLPSLFIPVTELVFKNQDQWKHTTLVCSPINLNYSFSYYPITLSFTTPIPIYCSPATSPYNVTTNGDLVYGLDGILKRAHVCFWRYGKGYLFNYNTVDGVFQLTQTSVFGADY